MERSVCVLSSAKFAKDCPLPARRIINASMPTGQFLTLVVGKRGRKKESVRLMTDSLHKTHLLRDGVTPRFPAHRKKSEGRERAREVTTG